MVQSGSRSKERVPDKKKSSEKVEKDKMAVERPSRDTEKKKRTASSSSSSSSRSRSHSSSSSGSSSSGSSSSSSSRSGSSSSSDSSSSESRSRSHSRTRNRKKSEGSPRRREKKRSPTPRPTKVHIGRLTRNVNKEHIIEIFSVYGTIKNLDMPSDRVHPTVSKGYAYIDYEKPEEAEKAVKHMDGGQIDGQEITAQPVLAPRPAPRPPRRSPPRRGPPPRWGRPSPPRYRDRRPSPPRRRSPPPRRRSRSRSPVRRRRYSRSSSSSSRSRSKSLSHRSIRSRSRSISPRLRSRSRSFSVSPIRSRSRSPSPRTIRPQARSVSPGPTKIYVDGLTRNVTKEHLHEVFSACGEVKSIHMAPIRGHLRSRGYAFVEYLLPAEAENALQNLNGEEINGREINVMRRARNLLRYRSRSVHRAQSLIRSRSRTPSIRWSHSRDRDRGSRSKSLSHRSIRSRSRSISPRLRSRSRSFSVSPIRSRSRSPSPRTIRPRARSVSPGPTKIYVDGLTSNVTKKCLHEVFSACGEVKSIHMAPIRGHLRSRGYAFVEYLLPAEAENALQNLNGEEIDGREINVMRRARNLLRSRSRSADRARSLIRSRSRSAHRARSLIRSRSRSRSPSIRWSHSIPWYRDRGMSPPPWKTQRYSYERSPAGRSRYRSSSSDSWRSSYSRSPSPPRWRYSRLNRNGRWRYSRDCSHDRSPIRSRERRRFDRSPSRQSPSPWRNQSYGYDMSQRRRRMDSWNSLDRSPKRRRLDSSMSTDSGVTSDSEYSSYLTSDSEYDSEFE